jgi:predicted SAM-dependent methyltransferase
MKNANKLQLNIGAAVTRIPGFVNIDIAPNADISLDLNRDRLPFNDNSVDLVFSYHTVEHVENYLFALGEIHRVLKHKGKFLLGVPYVTATRSNLVNPYHHQNFDEYSFDFFDPERLKGSASEENNIFFKKVFHEFRYMSGFKLLHPPIRNWCRKHFLNVVKKIDFGLLAIKYPEEKVILSKKDIDEMKKEFKDCKARRIKYG